MSKKIQCCIDYTCNFYPLVLFLDFVPSTYVFSLLYLMVLQIFERATKSSIKMAFLRRKEMTPVLLIILVNFLKFYAQK